VTNQIQPQAAPSTSSSKIRRQIALLMSAAGAVMSTGAMAAPPLVINNVGAPTQVGTGAGKRAIWTNAGTVGADTVDIVGVLTTATLNHTWTTTTNRPSITSVGVDNIFIEWRLYKAGTYNVTTGLGGVPVLADVHVQFNDVDGPNNERVFAPVCAGDIKWIRIQDGATTGRAFGTVASQPEMFSLIGDKNYNNEPESGLEIYYPDRSVFKMGRTATSGFLIRLDNPTYSAFTTYDYECADFTPPTATNDIQQGVPGTPTVLNILDNDTVAQNNNNATNNNSLKPSEFGRSTVNLVAPPGATGTITDAKGDVVGFTVPGEGTWAYSDTTGELTFTPIAGFTGTATPIFYTFDNALGIASNAATVTVWYPGIGVTKTSTFNDDIKPDSFAQIGETISYIYRVTSKGAGALNPVTLTETGFTGAGTAPVPTLQSGDTNSDGKLDSAETWIYTATYALVAADIAGSGVSNQATAEGTAPDGTIVKDKSDSGNPGDGNGTATAGPGAGNDDPTRSALTKAPIAASADSTTPVSGATGAADIFNILSNDSLSSAPVTIADVDISILTPATDPGVTLDIATGLVSVAPGTPAGSYSIQYKICEKLNPTNCATALASVTVTASPIAAANDSGTPVNGFVGNPAAFNAFANDTLNGAPVVANDIVATVVTPASNPGVTLDVATGDVAVAAGTPAGSYTIAYKICDKADLTNCANASITVVVAAPPIAATNDAAGPVTTATGGTNLVDALANDTLNGAPVTAAQVVISIETLAANAGVTLDTITGQVSVAPGTPAGSYTIGYKICENLNATNCALANIVVTVAPTPIAANNDTPPAVSAGTPSVVNAFANDQLNGVAVDPAKITATVTMPASNPGVALDPVSGNVSVAPGTPAGTYTIAYKICETANPSNCANASVTVIVNPPAIAATNDNAGPVNGLTGGVNLVDALANDTLNGVAVVLADVNLTVTSPASNPGVTLNPATGQVSIAPGTPAGSYSIGYQVCEKLNPANCANATVAVVVTPAPIAATADMPAPVNGTTGASGIINAFANDTLNGAAVDPAKITATITTPASNPGVTMDPATGLVSVAAGTPAGTYTIAYEICEKLNPTNCATSTVTVVVEPAPIAAMPDAPAPVNGRTGAPSIINAFANDTLNSAPVDPAKITAAITSPASNSGVTMDPATGLVSVAAGTPAGSYTIGYKICETANPANCANTVVTVVVAPAPIAATNDTTAQVNGLSGGANLVDALANDTLNGVAVVRGDVNLSVTSPASNPGVTLDPATGQVSVAPGTPAGNYSIGYQICEKLNPASCATATIAVVVGSAPIAASNDTPPAVNGLTGAMSIVNAFANDTLNGAPVDPTKIIATVTTPASNPGVALDPATGLVSVAAGTPAGSYTIGYQICETLNPANCANATVTIVVQPAPIAAGPDAPAPINGAAGNPNVINAFANDTLNGAPVDPAKITATVKTPASDPGVVLDPATGSVSVAPGTPAGTYTIAYEICEKLNPTNCATSTVTVVVEAAPIAATVDAPAPVNGATGNPSAINAFANDTLNGVPVDPAKISATITTPASNPGVVLDPVTGNVSIAPGTPAGTYSIGYKICETLNPTNCATATVMVVVQAPPIAAVADTPAPVNGVTGGNGIVNAFANDRLNGAPVDPAKITATITAPAANSGVTMDPATGLVSVAPGTPAGSYTIGYKICETLNPTNCATSTVTVVVEPAPLAATNDAPPAVDGKAGNPNVVNAFANDTLNGQPVIPANIVATILSPASNPGVVLDPATGVVSVASGTPAGTYAIDYQICEKLNPANCKTATVTVTVAAAPIAATANAPAPVSGITGSPNLINALANDTLAGQAVVIGDVNLVVKTPASNPGVTLDPATGLVSVAPATPAGTYTIGYEICEKLNPTNCATSVVTVVVAAAPIAATNDSVPTVSSNAGAPNVVNAFANDVLNGAQVDPARITAAITSPASNPGVSMDPATGNVSVAPGTPAGTYSIGYQICETLNPTNCATATVMVVVNADPIAASVDAPAPINGATGNPSVINAFANDMLNGAPVDPAKITATVTTPASDPGVVLNPATGNVSVAPGTPAGTYTITYQICETLNPANCATGTVTVVVTAPAIVATIDTPAPVTGGVGNPNAANAFANDMINGQPVDPTKITANVVSPASNPGIVLDPATGNVSVAADVPPGTYTIHYQICETINPTNCAVSSVTVVVLDPRSALTGTVFTDTDGDGRLDAGEPLQRGWIVEVMHDGKLVGTVLTDVNGFYQVDNLLSGPGYQIMFRNPENRVVYDIIKNVTLAGNTTVADQNQPIDPSGILYDSVTRAPVSGASVTLVDARGTPLPAICFVDASQSNQRTGTSGQYRFDLLPGAASECPVGETVYAIAITPPAGFAAPSTVLLPQIGALDPTGRTGPVRVSPSANPPQAADPATYYLSFRLASGDPDVTFNHIPLDPFLTRTPLIVTKTSPKRSASTGDLVPYTITVRNTENVQRAGVDVVDILPQGFKYVLGTASVNNVPAEPAQTDRQLTWRGQIIPANGSVAYNLTMVVGAGVTGGEKVNTGLAQSGADGAAISNRGTAVVSITPSAVFDCSELLGKVFEDSNGNGYQDGGERGLPAVRLVTVNGQLITTDEFGRYHIACAAVPDARIGSNFVLKVDPRTLPPGYELTQDNPQSIRLTRGKFGELNFGAAPTARTVIKLTSDAFVPGTAQLKPEFARQIGMLPNSIKGERPAILLSYALGQGESATSADSGVKAMAKQIEAALRAANPNKAVSVETSVARATDAAGRE
jgi:large repetitive protein